MLVARLFDWYLESGATVYRLARRLTDLGVPTPMGKRRWNVASVRGILRNPAYAGRALCNRTQVVPARNRKSAMLPVGPGQSHAPRPEEDWIAVPVPPVVSEEVFAQVQAKLDTNQQTALRNTRHEYLLRALVSCGKCGLSCLVRQTPASYRYYLCRGRTDGLRAAHGQRCTARYIPAGQLDELVWAGLCALLTDPAQLTRALARAKGGAWLPQELHARQATIRQAVNQLERQQQRLLDAYPAEVIDLAELERKREDLDRRHAALTAQHRQLDAAAGQQLELRAVANGIEASCQTIRTGLGTATFTQRRQLAELLIDRVIVTDDQVEIRYVLPTSPDGPHRPFCQLRKDHLDVTSTHQRAWSMGHRARSPAWWPVAKEAAVTDAQLDRTRRFWDRFAGRYDQRIEHTERMLFPGGREWACAQAAGDVLEVAVGTGRNLPYYRRVQSLTGIDLSPGMLAVARHRAMALGIYADLRTGNAEALEFGDATFDTVVCAISLCNIPDDRAAIREMYRVLKPGGRLVLLDHVASDRTWLRVGQWLLEQVTRRTNGDYQTRRPLPLVEAQGLATARRGVIIC